MKIKILFWWLLFYVKEKKFTEFEALYSNYSNRFVQVNHEELERQLHKKSWIKINFIWFSTQIILDRPAWIIVGLSLARRSTFEIIYGSHLTKYNSIEIFVIKKRNRIFILVWEDLGLKISIVSH